MKSKLIFLVTLLALSSCGVLSRRADDASIKIKEDDVEYRNQVRHTGRRDGRAERSELRHKDRAQVKKERRLEKEQGR